MMPEGCKWVVATHLPTSFAGVVEPGAGTAGVDDGGDVQRRTYEVVVSVMPGPARWCRRSKPSARRGVTDWR